MPTNQRSELLQALAEGDASNFASLALAVFRYQANENPLYRQFLSLLGKKPESVERLQDIPFLPIAFFKSQLVQSGQWAPESWFSSSGTTGQIPSRHAVRDLQAYLDNTQRGFEPLYGPIRHWRILALLPSYLERSGSSLVAMADHFIQLSGHPDSGFFLHNHDELAHVLQQRKKGEHTLLLGVSFALLDFAAQHPMDLSDVTIMETGGMKGRREEMTREELHNTLREAFNCEQIHSEYGMTELFSQAYTLGGSFFQPAPTLRALTFESNDPFCPALPGKTGVLNLIDLANLDTCSFIATEDLGRIHPDGRFEVLGRLDAAEMRGCNLMVE